MQLTIVNTETLKVIDILEAPTTEECETVADMLNYFSDSSLTNTFETVGEIGATVAPWW